MTILTMKRGEGKTTAAIQASAEGKTPIVCVTEAQRRYIKERAKSLSLEIPEPIPAARVVNWAALHLDEVIIDDLDCVLSVLLHANVAGATLTTTYGAIGDHKVIT